MNKSEPKEQAQTEAEDTLVYYFKKLFEKTGLNWSEDNEEEIRGIVQNILKV